MAQGRLITVFAIVLNYCSPAFVLGETVTITHLFLTTTAEGPLDLSPNAYLFAPSSVYKTKVRPGRGRR